MYKILPISFLKVSYTTKSSGNASASPDWYGFVSYLAKGYKTTHSHLNCPFLNPYPL